MYTYIQWPGCKKENTATYVYIRARLYYDTYVPTVRHFLACEDVAGGSQQSGGPIVFFPEAQIGRAHV